MYYKKNFKRMSSFYVNEVHLITMLLPYIENKIKEDDIITVLQDDLEKTVNLLLAKINLKEELKEKIKGIDWKAKNIKDCKKLENAIGNKTVYIIINGNERYIKEINKQIRKFNNKDKDVENKTILINCYNIVEFNKNIIEILNQTDKILNTSGEHEIEEIFPEFVREKEKIRKKA